MSTSLTTGKIRQWYNSVLGNRLNLPPVQVNITRFVNNPSVHHIKSSKMMASVCIPVLQVANLHVEPISF
jgi:hypothetical protein